MLYRIIVQEKHMNQYRRKFDTRKELIQYYEDNHKKTDEVVIFVTGTANTSQSVGHYEYAAFNNTWQNVKSGDFSDTRSVNRTILMGIIRAIEEIELTGITTYTIILSACLGFKKGKKGSGVNADLIQSIISKVSAKGCTLNVVECSGCSRYIKGIIEECFVKSGVSNSSSAITKTQKQAKKSKYYAIKSIDGKVCNQILRSWDECKALVDHHKSAFKSFTTEEEALQYLGTDNKQQCVTTESAQKIEFSIPESLYKKFQNKLGIMGYTKEMVLLDLVSDWCSYDE